MLSATHRPQQADRVDQDQTAHNVQSDLDLDPHSSILW